MLRNRTERFSSVRAVSLVLAVLFVVSWPLKLSLGLGVLGDSSGDPLNDRGYELLNKHDYTNAKKYFDTAIQRAPDQWRGYYNRAVLFHAQNNLQAALADLNTTIRLEPAFFGASWMRAIVYRQLHNYAACLKDLNALAKVTPQVKNWGELALTLNSRAWLYATCPEASFRNGQLAVADAKTACEIENWKRSGSIDTLAAACAEAGDFNSAVRYEEQAITLNKSGSDEEAKSTSRELAKEFANRNPQRLQDFSRRLESYKQHRPYRDTPGR